LAGSPISKFYKTQINFWSLSFKVKFTNNVDEGLLLYFPFRKYHFNFKDSILDILINLYQMTWMIDCKWPAFKEGGRYAMKERKED